MAADVCLRRRGCPGGGGQDRANGHVLQSGPSGALQGRAAGAVQKGAAFPLLRPARTFRAPDAGRGAKNKAHAHTYGGAHTHTNTHTHTCTHASLGPACLPAALAAADVVPLDRFGLPMLRDRLRLRLRQRQRQRLQCLPLLLLLTNSQKSVPWHITM